MIRFVSVFFIFFVANAMAQTPVRIVLNGKVSSQFSEMNGVYVINLKTEQSVLTDNSGGFRISALAGDTLLFSGMQYKEIRIVLTAEDFQKEMVVIHLEPILNQLDEVIIKRYDNINAISLGIISPNIKSYTPAERKLRTATGLNASATTGTMAGGSVSVDPLINWISGRTAQLKKELKVEKKEYYLRLLENMFDRNHFVNKLKIPSNYVKGFEYYAVENEKFTIILNSKNKTTTEFLLGELATKYNEIIANEE